MHLKNMFATKEKIIKKKLPSLNENWDRSQAKVIALPNNSTRRSDGKVFTSTVDSARNYSLVRKTLHSAGIPPKHV